MHWVRNSFHSLFALCKFDADMKGALNLFLSTENGTCVPTYFPDFTQVFCIVPPNRVPMDRDRKAGNLGAMQMACGISVYEFNTSTYCNCAFDSTYETHSMTGIAMPFNTLYCSHTFVPHYVEGSQCFSCILHKHNQQFNWKTVFVIVSTSSSLKISHIFERKREKEKMGLNYTIDV